jgi:uncharacterized membrane protein
MLEVSVWHGILMHLASARVLTRALGRNGLGRVHVSRRSGRGSGASVSWRVLHETKNRFYFKKKKKKAGCYFCPDRRTPSPRRPKAFRRGRQHVMKVLLLLALGAMLGHATDLGRPLLPLRAKPASRKPRLLNKAAVGQAVLCTLAVQNACQMLSMRYSRMPGQPRYLTSTAVVLAELVKMVSSFAILVMQQGLGRASRTVWTGLVLNWKDTLLVGVPALLYLVQNNLLYVATTHLDAATCQVAYQLKLLTTAFFTVLLLKRQIPRRRWLALGLLFIGVVFVQLPSGGAATASQSPILGTASVAAACLLSGLAGVWLEKIVKGSAQVPIWLRNMQVERPKPALPS